MISAYYWAGYPYDHLCETGTDVNTTYPGYSGNFTADIVEQQDEFATYFFGEDGSTVSVNITIDPTDQVYKFCNQDLLTSRYGRSFPFIPSQQENREGEWMTPEQEQVTTVFGWTSVAVICLVSIRLILGSWKSFKSMFFGSYKVRPKMYKSFSLSRGHKRTHSRLLSSQTARWR